MADVGTFLLDHIVLNAVTFTGNIDLRTPTSGKRILVTGWTLQTEGHTAGTCRVTIATNAVEHSSMLFPAVTAAGTTASLNVWTVTGARFEGVPNAVLKLLGGVGSGTISGTVFCHEIA